jgi:purine-binding chemotaxis protein CheW
MSGGSGGLSTTDAQRILRERARALARVPATERDEDRVHLLAFRMGGERFALEAAALVEVFRAREIARLPQTEAPFFGVTVWRGALLTILDLRALLGLRTSMEDQLTHVAALQSERSTLGVLMELEREMVSVPRSELVPCDEPGGYVRAVGRSGLQLLDAAALLRL